MLHNCGSHRYNLLLEVLALEALALEVLALETALVCHQILQKRSPGIDRTTSCKYASCSAYNRPGCNIRNVPKTGNCHDCRGMFPSFRCHHLFPCPPRQSLPARPSINPRSWQCLASWFQYHHPSRSPVLPHLAPRPPFPRTSQRLPTVFLRRCASSRPENPSPIRHPP